MLREQILKRGPVWVLFPMVLLLSGCVREISIVGIYVPAWIFSLVAGAILGTFVSLRVEPRLVPEPGAFQMVLRLAWIAIFFVLSYYLFFNRYF
ncbi:MAG: hypothetical protein SFY92_02865 [Verrucomicrobiae bacterium]|nr:hypothetical protein [Verrucomicrobiae bacterium]